MRTISSDINLKRRLLEWYLRAGIKKREKSKKLYDNTDSSSHEKGGKRRIQSSIDYTEILQR